MIETPDLTDENADEWARWLLGPSGVGRKFQWPLEFAIQERLPTEPEYMFAIRDESGVLHPFGVGPTWVQAWERALVLGGDVIPGLTREELQECVRRYEWARAAPRGM